MTTINISFIVIDHHMRDTLETKPQTTPIPRWKVILAVGGLAAVSASVPHFLPSPASYCEITIGNDWKEVPADADLTATIKTIPGIDSPPCQAAVDQMMMRQRLAGKQLIMLPQSVNGVHR